MKYTIRKQFTLIFIIVMISTILVCWFINSTFLGKFYLQKKEDSMMDTYYFINKSSKEGTMDTDSFNIEFQNICGKNNIDIVILDTGAQTVKSSTNDFELLGRILMRYVFESGNEVSGGKKEDRILKSNEIYEMRMSIDERTKQEYIDMWGVLEDGNLFLFRSPLESIRDSVKIANSFLTYVGLGAALLSALIIMYITGRITKPIKELTQISERMIKLDFDAKYSGRNKTELALLGQNINELSGTLESTISELKSANNELQKDIEKKEQMEQMRTEFLSNVSHELKTPIALIQGYAEGLRDGISDDEESRNYYCEVIVDEADKMNQMVQKLLTLNQLEFGNNIVAMERFDLTEMISSYLESSLLLCKQKGICLQMEEYPPVHVWANAYYVEEVFNNYFTNALHYVSGKKEIEIKIAETEKKVRISVFNTGNPIPEESIDHIWEKFYKVDKARTREYGGNGVGLSIVRAIMNSMNQQYGVINYENGVEFWFELDSGRENI